LRKRVGLIVYWPAEKCACASERSTLELHAGGHHQQALAGLDKLHAQRDALLAQLNRLLPSVDILG
jgi:hypothetical protein